MTTSTERTRLNSDAEEQVGALRVLDQLTGPCVPRVKGRVETPLWMLPRRIPAMRMVHEVSWDWELPGLSVDRNALVDLDCNGAFLAPVESLTLAHRSLRRTGSIPFDGRAGVYQLDLRISREAGNHVWSDSRICSPLGGIDPQERFVWLPHPTVTLLHELGLQGLWPELTIADSWTGMPPQGLEDDLDAPPQEVRLRTWATWLREQRIAALSARDMGDQGAYERFKLGYAVAFQMMNGPGTGRKEDMKSKLWREDWYHAVHAAYRANQWRKAWQCVQAGVGPAAMHSVDVLSFTTDTLREITAMDHTIPYKQGGSPIRFDFTGRRAGSFKIDRLPGAPRAR